MIHLSNIFQKLKPFRAMVLGDFLLDTYTTGIVRRISPEAPVPILEVKQEDARPGGAGNVALCLKALGAHVSCVGRVGPDLHGDKLKDLLSMDHSLVLTEKGYITPVKNRLIANSQQLMRIDREKVTPLDPHLEAYIVQELEAKIAQMDVVAISDYGKGFLTKTLLESVISIAKEKKVPVIVDPKGIDFSKYRGATLIKPNLSEAYLAAKMDESTALTEVAKALFEDADPQHLLITRSEAGLSLFSKEGIQQNFPVISREVKDVTGAGDTVLSTICLGMANGLDLSSTLRLANIAAGIVIEKLGCCQVTIKEIQPHLENHPLYKQQQTALS